MKRKLLRILSIIFILIFIFAAIVGVLFYQLYLRCYIVTLEPNTFTASSENLSNPYCGWYEVYAYTLSDSDRDFSETAASNCDDYPYELALLEINLCNFASSEISATGLAQLEQIFAAWQNSKKQLIVRFLYDWSGNARMTEPKDISIIECHMSQTAELVNQYKDNIYLLQGIFIGNYAEMNNSNYMDEESMIRLTKHLASVIDSSIYLSVRTPAQWRTICQSYEPLDSNDAFSGSLASRLGLFNDGMLGSGSDLSTYGDTSLSLAETYSDKGTREDEINFQNNLCLYVPNGGEVVNNNSYNDLSNAIADLKAMHVSYLNSMYDEEVLEKWKSTVYEGDDCFNGCSGYDYIENHLGYRYTFMDANCSFNTLSDDSATLELTIENSGFSGSYHTFTPTLTAINQETGEIYTISVDTDTRYWFGNETVTLSIPLDIRNWSEGNYTLYFSLTNPTDGEQITFANTLDLTEYGYQISALSIEQSPEQTLEFLRDLQISTLFSLF